MDKNAFVAARSRPGGVHLGLSERFQTTVCWQGRSGLITSKIKEQINMMTRYEDPPNIIIIHIGGYDMGHIRLGYLQLMLRRMFDWLWVKYPESFLVWSQMIPRINWRYSDNVEAMDRTRRRINSTDAKYVVCNGEGLHTLPRFKTQHNLPDA